MIVLVCHQIPSQSNPSNRLAQMQAALADQHTQETSLPAGTDAEVSTIVISTHLF
jgi:hypothetical protein